MSSHHPSIDEFQATLSVADDSSDETNAILAVGRDLAAQMGRLVDHLTIEQVVRDAEAFGRYPAGHPVDRWPDAPLDPNVATRDEASVALRAAPSAR